MLLNRLRTRFGSIAARIRAWPRVLQAVLLLVTLGLVAGSAYGMVRGYTYTRNDPNFCRSCHTMGDAWDRWKVSEHRNVGCKKCHEASVVESARQVITFAIQQPEHVGRHAVVPKHICAACHESGDPKWRQVAATAGHSVHERDRKIECVVCHAPSIHSFRPPTAVCGTCHVAQTSGERVVKIRAMAETHCTECHQFLRADSPLRPTRQSCLDCHRLIPSEVGSWPPDAPMQFACGQCHRPHEQAAPVVSCQACHERPREDIHTPDLIKSTACTVCHIPHRWRPGQ